MQDPPPIIITAALNETAFAFFDGLRRAHFPAHRNHIPAHLTLFHALPGRHEPTIMAVLRSQCQKRGPIPMLVARPWSLGQGVAYRISSPGLEDLRKDAVGTFAPWLTAQDRARFRPHITIQNKAKPADARRLLERLDAAHEPFEIEAVGLLAWRYLGGPWEAVAQLHFELQTKSDAR
jgi:2'-5' RNA ligase